MKFEVYGKSEQVSPADVSGAILDRFIEENREVISAGNFGVVEQNLMAEVSRELAIAERSHGLEFAKNLARYLEDDLDNYRSELDAPEDAQGFKDSIRNFLKMYQAHEETISEVS